MTVSAYLEADLATIPDVSGVTARTFVALPPSELDPSTVIGGTVYDDLTVYGALTMYSAEYLIDEMRVYVNGALVHRAYDPEVN